jgi:hypothetical protein
MTLHRSLLHRSKWTRTSKFSVLKHVMITCNAWNWKSLIYSIRGSLYILWKRSWKSLIYSLRGSLYITLKEKVYYENMAYFICIVFKNLALCFGWIVEKTTTQQYVVWDPHWLEISWMCWLLRSHTD